MDYKQLADTYAELEKTSLRLEKTRIVADLLKKTTKHDLTAVVRLLQGKLFADHESEHTGISAKLIIKTLARIASVRTHHIEKLFKKHGDLGIVTQELLGTRKQTSLFSKKLSVDDVYTALRKFSHIEGKGSTDTKLDILSSLLVAATPQEACYITRTVIENLRIGLGAGTVRDAMVWAYAYDIEYDKENNDIQLDDEQRTKYNAAVENVQHALDITNDYAAVAHALVDGSLDDLSLEIGRPIKMMLYQKATSISDAFEIVGKPAAFEYKYDGFRVQIHKKGTQIQVFTRRLDDVSRQFPDIVLAAKHHINAGECILDAEAVCFDPKSGRYLPFQIVSQRIKRKYDIEKLQKKYPVEVHVFDLLQHGKSVLDIPFGKRREELTSIIDEAPKKMVLAKQLITDDEAKAQLFYEESLGKGEEGIMAKSLDAPYKPGSRVGYGVKIKQIMEPLDLVIIGAEYGEGKRSGWLSSFDLACKDDDQFLAIGKVSTGLKEKQEEGTSFDEMTKILEPLITKSQGKHVELQPKIAIEVGYEEIQRSNSYSSGFALRFPRFLRLRTDEKTADDANTLDDVKELYDQQRGRSV